MKGKVSLYFDEQIRRRVHNVYDYFSGTRRRFPD